MTKENSKRKLEKSLAYQSQKNAIELVTFFFTYTGKEIKENNEKFKFWQRVFLEQEEFNTLEFRKEFLRIGDLLEALDVLASKFDPDQILKTLRDSENMLKITKRVLKEEFGEEDYNG